jgi:TrmH family RNA methyltransferase
VESITSRKNPLIALVRDLARDRSGDAVLLDGLHLVEEAEAARLPIELVIISASRLDHEGPPARLAERLEQTGVRLIRVSDPVITAVSPARSPSGIVAVARLAGATRDRLLERQPALLIVLAGVQDPGNVGAAVRAAEAGGATGAIVTDGTADPFGWKALRGSMGSAFRLPIAFEPDASQILSWARAHGLRSLAAAPHGGRCLYEADLSGPSLLVLGAEGAGVPPGVLTRIDEAISIPMRAPVESLNVAVTAALLVYEARRQRERQDVAP